MSNKEKLDLENVPRLTREQAVILGAYTGRLFGPFDEMHEYIEKLMGRPVYLGELCSEELVNEVRGFAKADLSRIIRGS